MGVRLAEGRYTAAGGGDALGDVAALDAVGR